MGDTRFSDEFYAKESATYSNKCFIISDGEDCKHEKQLENEIKKNSAIVVNDGQASTNVQEWTPPDGGYGWVMVVLCFFTLFLFISYTQLGVFLLPLQEQFQVSKTSITWLNSAHTVVGRLTGIFVGQILSRAGSRIVLAVVTILYAGSYFITSFVESFPLLFLTFGVMPSIASGGIVTVSMTSLQQYFNKRRSIANGLAAIGVSVGTFSWSPLASQLLKTFGWQIALRIESAMFLAIGLTITVFLHPPDNQRVWLDCRRFYMKDHKPPVAPAAKSQDKKSTNICKGFKNPLDFSVLNNLPLCILWLGLIVAGIGYLTNSIYMPVRAEMYGIEQNTAAFTTSVLGIAGGIGVPTFSFIGNTRYVRRDVMMAAGMTVTGILTLLSTLFDTSLPLLIFAGLIGFTGASFLGVSFVVAVDMIEPHMIPAASGFQAATLGISHLIAHPVIGVLLDETGNPQAPFYMGGTAFLVGGMILWTVPILRNRKARRTHPVVNSIDLDVTTQDKKVSENKSEEDSSSVSHI